MFEFVPKFDYFRRHHELAVGLIRVRKVVALVVVLCWGELFHRLQFRDDRGIPNPARIQFSD